MAANGMPPSGLDKDQAGILFFCSDSIFFYPRFDFNFLSFFIFCILPFVISSFYFYFLAIIVMILCLNNLFVNLSRYLEWLKRRWSIGLNCSTSRFSSTCFHSYCISPFFTFFIS